MWWTRRGSAWIFVRFNTAILDAGLNESYEKAKTRLAASTERFRTKAYHWGAGAESFGNSAGREEHLQRSSREREGRRQNLLEPGQGDRLGSVAIQRRTMEAAYKSERPHRIERPMPT